MIWLDEPFKSAWANKDPFAEVGRLSQAAAGEHIYRDKEGRRTLRFEQHSHSYFLKHHGGVGWKEIFKNLLQGRLPVLGARNEYDAANTLGALGIDTLQPAAFGERGANPARRESFLITGDLVDTVSLEDYCRPWKTSKPSFVIKRALIQKVARSARIMHDNGINHRDFYLCHFLLEQQAQQKIQNGMGFHCYLIDLHRCQMRKTVPHRWRVKDLGGLLYSALDCGLTRRDCLRFLREYSARPLRQSWPDPLWQEVWRNAEKLYQKDFGKKAPRIF